MGMMKRIIKELEVARENKEEMKRVKREEGRQRIEKKEEMTGYRG